MGQGFAVARAYCSRGAERDREVESSLPKNSLKRRERYLSFCNCDIFTLALECTSPVTLIFFGLIVSKIISLTKKRYKRIQSANSTSVKNCKHWPPNCLIFSMSSISPLAYLKLDTLFIFIPSLQQQTIPSYENCVVLHHLFRT